MSAIPDAVKASYLCRSRSPDLDLFAMGSSQTADVGHLNRLGALAEKLDKCVSAWYNLMQDENGFGEEAAFGFISLRIKRSK